MSRYRKLGRSSSHRMMMFRNQTTDLFKYGQIVTTNTRAKELQRFAEKMVTLAKRGDIHSRRQAAAFLLDKEVLRELFAEIGPKYEDRNGGYTRMYRIGPRRGDAAMMVKIELV